MQRISIYLTDSNGTIHDFALLQYVFDDNEHEVKVKPHGNSKSLSKEYYRTSHTTMERLKEPAKSDPPKTVFFKSIEEKGTISNFINAASHARNVQQIKNIKKTMEEQPGDSTLELIDMRSKETETKRTPSSVK